jgi:hypothetical protein
VSAYHHCHYHFSPIAGIGDSCSRFSLVKVVRAVTEALAPLSRRDSLSLKKSVGLGKAIKCLREGRRYMYQVLFGTFG